MVKTRKADERSLYRRTTLRNGLRVVTERLPSVRSVSIGVWIDVGSRNEVPQENGLSHFLEHMVFKGTRRRSAKQIASSLESIGGGLNGFTSREHTCFTARILDQHLEEAVDVLADICCNATLTNTNVQKERLVISEEIKESLDTPSDHIHDLFAATFWGDHPLGRPIMGSPDNILSLTRKNLLAFRKQNYRSTRVVVAASGSVSHEKLVRLVRRSFEFAGGSSNSLSAPRRSEPRAISIKSNSNSQAHFCLGYPGVKYSDREKPAILILNSYLGGGMSSVLFQKIREERGLAYSVYTYHDFFRDCGIFGAYIGTDKDHLRLAYDVIQKEFKKVKTRKIPSATIDRTKEQIKGQVTLSLESTMARMNRLARLELLTQDFTTLSESFQEIEQVTPSDILEVANQVFDDDEMAMAVLGPVDEAIFDGVR
ncbi:MAG: insulinase family protein [Candidatus Zixiibacteriota bacterium]|nr:MAG: insulinase family protein [candidate division Zixibacteria bacterium]